MAVSTTNWSNLIPTSSASFEDTANASTNRVLTTVSGTLSLLGASLIIVSYIAWKDFRSASRRILIYISIADFFIAGTNVIGVWHHGGDDNYCKAQSFVSTTACLWSFFWTTFLAAFIYFVIAKKQRKKAEIMLKVFHVFGWGVPLIIVGTAFGLDKLGNDKDFFTSGWCWISSTLPIEERNFWTLITGKTWEIAACVLCPTFYLMLKWHIRREVFHHQERFPSEESKEIALKMERRLTLVPVVFILVRIWGTARFILYFAGYKSRHSWWEVALLYLQGIGDNLQGFANFLLFCFFTEKFQAHLRLAAHNLGLCKKQKSQGPTSVTESTNVTQSQETVVNERSRLLSP